MRKEQVPTGNVNELKATFADQEISWLTRVGFTVFLDPQEIVVI